MSIKPIQSMQCDCCGRHCHPSASCYVKQRYEEDQKLLKAQKNILKRPDGAGPSTEIGDEGKTNAIECSSGSEYTSSESDKNVNTIKRTPHGQPIPKQPRFEGLPSIQNLANPIPSRAPIRKPPSRKKNPKK